MACAAPWDWPLRSRALAGARVLAQSARDLLLGHTAKAAHPEDFPNIGAAGGVSLAPRAPCPGCRGRRVLGASLSRLGARPPRDLERPGPGEWAASSALGSRRRWDPGRAPARRGTPGPRSWGGVRAAPALRSGQAGRGSER